MAAAPDTITVVYNTHQHGHAPGDKVQVTVDEARLLYLDGTAHVETKTAAKALDVEVEKK